MKVRGKLTEMTAHEGGVAITVQVSLEAARDLGPVLSAEMDLGPTGEAAPGPTPRPSNVVPLDVPLEEIKRGKINASNVFAACAQLTKRAVDRLFEAAKERGYTLPIAAITDLAQLKVYLDVQTERAVAGKVVDLEHAGIWKEDL